MADARKTEQIIALVDKDTKAQIESVALSTGASRGAVVRAALKYGLRFAVRDAKKGRLN